MLEPTRATAQPNIPAAPRPRSRGDEPPARRPFPPPPLPTLGTDCEPLKRDLGLVRTSAGDLRRPCLIRQAARPSTGTDGAEPTTEGWYYIPRERSADHGPQLVYARRDSGSLVAPGSSAGTRSRPPARLPRKSPVPCTPAQRFRDSRMARQGRGELARERVARRRGPRPSRCAGGPGGRRGRVWEAAEFRQLCGRAVPPG